MQRPPGEREEAIRQQPRPKSAVHSVRAAHGTLALQRKADNHAVARMAARSRLDRDPDDGLPNRKCRPPQKSQLVFFQVGSRPASFASNPARHAVYRAGSVVYGLAGDFGGVSMAP